MSLILAEIVILLNVIRARKDNELVHSPHIVAKNVSFVSESVFRYILLYFTCVIQSNFQEQEEKSSNCARLLVLSTASPLAGAGGAAPVAGLGPQKRGKI